MFDLTTELPIHLNEVAKLVPPSRGGKRTHLSTILRWILQGVKGPCGEVVRLEALRLGGKWVTSKEALQRFCERLTPIVNHPDAKTVEAPRAPAARRRASERAARELDNLGI